jgi:tetratricopeptide (TPR) repeat protein
MAKRYFNWKLAVVLIMALVIIGVTAVGLRYWQREYRAKRALDTGNKAYDQHQWQEAASNLGRYLMVNRNDILILLKYAQAQMHIRPLARDNISQAIAAYRSILRIQDDHREAAERLVETYLLTQSAGEAELIATRQLELWAARQETAAGETTITTARMRHLRALALMKQREYQQARAELEQIVKAEPGYIAAYETLAALAQQRPEDIDNPPEYWLEQAVDNNPDSALAYTVRAAYLLRTKDPIDRTKALADLARVGQMDLSDPAVRLRVAAELMNAGELDKAEEHLATIKKTNPQTDDLWRISAQLAFKSKSSKNMAQTAKSGLKALAAQPWDFMPLAVELLIRADEYEHAQECVTQLREKGIVPATTAFLTGLLADRKGQTYDAVNAYRRAIELGDKSPQVRFALAGSLARTGDMQSALGQLRQVLSDNPNFIDGHVALARLLVQSGNWRQAEHHAMTARRLAPTALEPVLLHVQARMQTLAQDPERRDSGQWEQIDRDLAGLDSATNGGLEVRLLRLRSTMLRDNLTEAERLLTELRNAHPSELRVALAEARLLAAKQKDQELVSALNRLIDKFPQQIESVRYLAAVYARQGNRQKCQAVITDALSRIDNPPARRELSLLLADFYGRWEQHSY